MVQQSDGVISVGTIVDFQQLQLNHGGVRAPLVVTGVERLEQWHDLRQKEEHNELAAGADTAFYRRGFETRTAEGRPL